MCPLAFLSLPPEPPTGAQRQNQPGARSDVGFCPIHRTQGAVSGALGKPAARVSSQAARRSETPPHGPPALTWPSALAVANLFPSGENRTQLTKRLWSCRRGNSYPPDDRKVGKVLHAISRLHPTAAASSESLQPTGRRRLRRVTASTCPGPGPPLCLGGPPSSGRAPLPPEPAQAPPLTLPAGHPVPRPGPRQVLGWQSTGI